MKKLIPAMSIGALMALASLGAQAADGTITITGTVTDTTCSINGGTAGAAFNKTIVLPTVTASSLRALGETAGTSQPADLEFKLTSCSSGTKAIASFENGPLIDQGNGNLINTGTAKNVQVQLLNANMAPINVTTNSNNQLATDGGAISGGAADLKYYARYFATGQAEAGTVNTSVQFSMQYQ